MQPRANRSDDGCKGQSRRDTSMEIAVRRALHAAGIRYRIDTRLEPDLRARGDIVWCGRKLVVFLEGCFWHACPQHVTWPKANADWWRGKLEANVARDRWLDRQLKARGWLVLRFWEHEASETVAQHIIKTLRDRR
ncbi:DNA mismatch endonuclease Vsr [Amycolatopsis sp. lyj-84]|uniref:DNA mismatch endonuclease Vsr n=1 Tax=Amycolatopsis sp. lyj-84 TaxID=2789284 RepID=UPI003979925F